MRTFYYIITGAIIYNNNVSHSSVSPSLCQYIASYATFRIMNEELMEVHLIMQQEFDPPASDL